MHGLGRGSSCEARCRSLRLLLPGASSWAPCAAQSPISTGGEMRLARSRAMSKGEVVVGRGARVLAGMAAAVLVGAALWAVWTRHDLAGRSPPSEPARPPTLQCRPLASRCGPLSCDATTDVAEALACVNGVEQVVLERNCLGYDVVSLGRVDSMESFFFDRRTKRLIGRWVAHPATCFGQVPQWSHPCEERRTLCGPGPP